jgi:hypothetical protein
VVAPANAREIVKQWLDVHHLPQAPMSEGVVDGYPRRVWWNAAGDTIVESYTITNMSHGTPLGVAENEQRYGRPGPFMLEAGISSSHHIAKFFGLTERVVEAKAEPKKTELQKTELKKAESKPEKKAARPVQKPVGKAVKVNGLPTPVIPPVPMPDFTQAFDPLVMMQTRAERKQASEPNEAHPEPAEEPSRRGIDIGAVITRALTAAGLMK